MKIRPWSHSEWDKENRSEFWYLNWTSEDTIYENGPVQMLQLIGGYQWMKTASQEASLKDIINLLTIYGG